MIVHALTLVVDGNIAFVHSRLPQHELSYAPIWAFLTFDDKRSSLQNLLSSLVRCLVGFFSSIGLILEEDGFHHGQ